MTASGSPARISGQLWNRSRGGEFGRLNPECRSSRMLLSDATVAAASTKVDSAIGVFSVHNEPRRGPLENRSDSDLRGVTLRFHRGTDLDGYITLLDANTPYL